MASIVLLIKKYLKPGLKILELENSFAEFFLKFKNI